MKYDGIVTEKTCNHSNINIFDNGNVHQKYSSKKGEVDNRFIEKIIKSLEKTKVFIE